MIIKLLLIGALLYLIWTGMHRFKSLPPTSRKQMLLRGALFALIALLLLGALTGRAHWLGVIFAALIPFLRFGFGALMRLLPFWLNRGGTIPLKTEFLDIKIEIKSGRVHGTVRKGKFAQRALETLDEKELEELLTECQNVDKKATYILRHLRQQQTKQQSPPPEFGDPSYDESLEILGLKPNPTREDIITAHKRLIHKLHPDRGGSDFLAARVNQARDVLLKKHGK